MRSLICIFMVLLVTSSHAQIYKPPPGAKSYDFHIGDDVEAGANYGACSLLFVGEEGSSFGSDRTAYVMIDLDDEITDSFAAEDGPWETCDSVVVYLYGSTSVTDGAWYIQMWRFDTVAVADPWNYAGNNDCGGSSSGNGESNWTDYSYHPSSPGTWNQGGGDYGGPVYDNVQVGTSDAWWGWKIDGVVFDSLLNGHTKWRGVWFIENVAQEQFDQIAKFRSYDWTGTDYDPYMEIYNPRPAESDATYRRSRLIKIR